ncbi:MAG: chemotaxis protein CheA [Gemmatimonadaceae bacterium]
MLKPSLHDIIARLLLVDREVDDDGAASRELTELLTLVAADAALPESVRALLVAATDRLSLLTASNRAAIVTDVERLVAAAQARLEQRDRLSEMMSDAPGTPEPPVHAAPTPVTTDAWSALPPDADVSFLGDFVAECRDLLEGAEAALLQLESKPDDVEAVNTIFRAFHTIKGTSAFLALEHITEFAHHAESVLSRVRDRQIRCVGGYAELALRSRDMLSALLDATELAMATGAGVLPDGYHALLAVVRDPDAAGVSEAPVRREQAARLADASGAAAVPSAASRLQDGGIRAATAGAQPDASVRVPTDRLDRLIEMVGELVIAQSMISQDPVIELLGHADLGRKIAHADKIVRELQDLSIAMRMVPLKAPFQKVARLVRDLAAKGGKQVAFVAMGEETEIDRYMVDFISDPLVHLIRNAMDHGIETPAERVATGKPACGTVRLTARHASGNVLVELSDDGRGLDRERILRKAIQNGLVASGEGLSDRDVYEFIFAPGFSTADQVTDVSGRGVGMDVVRRNIEALRGRVEIRSTPGQGTTFLVTLPLTLAVTDGMIVRVGTERYIIPTISIHVSFRPEHAMLSTIAGTGEVVMLRNEVMPLVRLHRVFGVLHAVQDPTKALLIVVGDGSQRTALLVDELQGQHQLVAKSLGDGIGRVSGISGGAILGDGRVGLILDVNELLALSRDGDIGRDHFPAAARAVA